MSPHCVVVRRTHFSEFYVSCSCGWQSRNVRSEMTANRLADHHGAGER